MSARDGLNFAAVTAQDADALVALRIAAMRESLERVGRFDPVRARDRFLAGFEPGATHHIELGGTRLGFFVLKLQDGTLLLDHLYIHPDHQGQGLGGRVLDHVFAQADRLALPVRVGALQGSDSNRFYLRHGFTLVETGEFDNYYVRPSAAHRTP